jgi:tRNA pseudouridine38-40 synthase
MSLNLKLTVAYDGTSYFGWQKTRTGMSIEETLEQAFEKILQHKVSLQAASRTDRGVHAFGQVVNVLLEKKVDLFLLQRGINAVLPKDISVRSIEDQSSTFHPTLDCKAKEYHYLICNSATQLPFFQNFSWHVPLPLSLDNMRKAAAFFMGEHDFSAFCNERALWTRSGVCELFEISLTSLENNRLKIAIKGDHFLYKMVRNLVGTLVQVGLGKIPAERMPFILESKDRTQAGITAPACGLTLHQVFY